MAKGLNIIAGLRLNTSAFTTSLRGASLSMNQFTASGAKGMSGLNVATGAFTIAALLAAKALGSAMTVMMDYSKATSELKAVLGGTSEEMAELSKQAQDLGGSTVHTATQVVELQIALSRLGFAQPEIIAMTESILHLGTAMGVALGEAATLVGSTIRAFKLEAEDSARVVDVLTLATTKSSLTFAKLKIALPYASTAASQFGLTIEQTAAMLGILSDRGLRASTIGTSMRKIFITLARKGLDFNTVMEDINSSTDKAAVAYKYFGLTAANAGIILAESGAEIDTLTGKLIDAEGATMAMAKTMADNLSGDITLAKSAWESFVLAVDDGTGLISKALRGLVTDITDVLKNMKLLADEGTSTKDKFKILGNAIISVSELALLPFIGALKHIKSLLEAITGKEFNIRFDVGTEGKAIDEIFNSKEFQKDLNKSKKSIKEGYKDAVSSAKEINKLLERTKNIHTEIGIQKNLIGVNDDAENEIALLGAELMANEELLAVHKKVINAKGNAAANDAIKKSLADIEAAKKLREEQEKSLTTLKNLNDAWYLLTLSGQAYKDEELEQWYANEKKKLDELTISTNEYYTALSQLDNAKINKQMSGMDDGGDGGTLDADELALGADNGGINLIAQTTPVFKNLNDYMKESINNAATLAGAFNTLGGAISGAIEGQDQIFANVAVGVLKSINKIINGLIAQMIVTLMAKGAVKGIGGLIAAGVAIPIAIGFINKAIENNKPDKNFAEGGIVGGTSFSGDNIVAGLNSGEMVLNKGQQAELFSMANGGGSGVGGGQVSFEIRGDKLVGVLSNYNRKMNKIR